MSIWNANNPLKPANLLNDIRISLLRSDLHSIFGERQFIWFPKSTTAYAVHMLEPTPNIGPLYCNCEVHPIRDCAAQFLYVRFAWSIFPNLSGFLNKPDIRRTFLRVRGDARGKREGSLRLRIWNIPRRGPRRVGGRVRRRRLGLLGVG